MRSPGQIVEGGEGVNLNRIIFSWQVSPFFGWGVIGQNFMLHWPGVALSSLRDPHGALAKDDPRAELLYLRCKQSRSWQQGFLDKSALWGVGKATISNDPVFVGLGNELVQSEVWGHYLYGSPTVAFPVFEDVESVRANIDRLREYPLVITASNWNHDVLAELGIASTMVHQGYDPALFNPGIRRPRADGLFRVFSGGKAEYRKGQDLVLEGFRIFAEKHDDAVLVAAWSSPWPQLGLTFNRVPLGPPPGAEIRQPNFAAWAQKAGIKRHQFELLPATPNYLMPEVLADVDCAVFASRFEGGTNIAAMECIGCGIPTILSDETGHRDLPHFGLSGNTPEQIAAALTAIYHNRDTPQTPDGRNAIEHFAWPARIAELVGVLEG